MLESENILLRRFAASGDAEAFSEIVQRHAGLVYAACLRVLADRDRAADAVQETFLQLLRNAATITGSVPTWLHRVATRKAIDVVRRDSSRKQREAKYAADKPQQVTKWQDLSRYVDEGLDELDEQTRQILIQHFFQGRTTKDIAAAQDISQPTASRRVESGVAQLREKLRRRGILAGSAVLVALLGENAVQAAPAIVLQELGKIALVGSQAAAAAGAGAAVSASSAGAKAAATGLLAGVKAKVVTVAAVTVIGVGSVATYNHVTQSPEVSPPAEQASVSQYSRRPSRTPPSPIQTQPVVRKAQTAEEPDWSQWDRQMWEQIFAEDAASAQPARPTAATPRPDEGEAEAATGGYYAGGYGGMMMGGYGGSAGASVGAKEAQYVDVIVDTNESATTIYRYGYDGSVRVYNVTPAESEESEEEAPERRD